MDSKKINTLKGNGSFNRNADTVNNALFKCSSYFDPHDLVQVKYEMLRAVRLDELSVSEASKQFGFSRTSYYKIEKRFEESGIDGLCLLKTGPKSPAKVTPDILGLAADLKAGHPKITNDEIVREIKSRSGVSIHKRSLQRERAKKKHA